MGDKKLNSDNEKRQDKKLLNDKVNNQDQKNNESNSNAQPLSDTSDASSTTNTSNATNNFDISSLADKAVDINVLRYEVDRLQLDFKAKAYFENDVRPLIDTLYSLSVASTSYAISASNMTNTNFGHSSKIKDALDLVEEVNEISEGLIKVLRCKVDNMLKLAKYDCDCK